MFCPKCGAENTGGEKFCPKCGAPMAGEAPAEASAQKAFCPKCGAESTSADKFCPKCGAPMGAGAGARSGSTMNMEPNVAGLLCYLFGWITGLIFFLIEKENKFVRFHAMQSIVVFGALNVLSIIFWVIPYVNLILGPILGIVSLVLWILLMVKAYQGAKFKLPVAGDIAEKQA